MKKNLAIIDFLLMDTELAVKWNDDEQSFISLKVLRDHCPCAFCSACSSRSERMDARIPSAPPS